MPVEVTEDAVSVFEVHDRSLFSRICQSLMSENGSDAVEPYAFYDDEGEMRSSRNTFLFVFNPLDLPWDDRKLLGKVHERLEDLYLSDDAIRQEVESAARELEKQVEGLGLLLQSDYELDVEWDIGKFLKSFDFSIDRDPDDPLIDNLSKFLRFAADACFEKTLVFVNLKTFLDEDDIALFYQEAFSLKIKVLLIESTCDERFFSGERKHVIDLGLLQS